ncbi:MAG: hypothetical protein BGO43_11800 [Gammaproteobacteria bacterium 39-13]|nr:hypothetical protein [Gammaproteobacteria bacterium]OJV85304.1 MAG: hypothetical protein BGO43_11800 [Gammaproteobacteria bacterium 39-13]
MANKPQNLLAGLSNSKTRTFVILLGAIIVVGVIVAIVRSKQTPEDVLSKQGSQAVPVPADIKATPGNVVPEKYRELQIQENERRAQEALQKKSSAIPTIIGAIGENSDKGNADAAALEQALKNRERDKLGKMGLGGADGNGFAGGGAFGAGGGAFGAGAGGAGGLSGKSAADRARELQEQRLREQREALERQRAEQERLKELERQRRLAEQQQREYEASVQKIASQMKNYANSAYAEWSKFPNQQYVQGDLATKPYKRSTPEAISQDGTPIGSGASGSGSDTRSGGASSRATRLGNVRPSTKKVFIKAGTIIFGVIDTAVNSDEPGPVLATIVSGKYHGGKLIGSFQHQAQQTSVIINFTQMTVPKKVKSFSVSAVAIDPDTARTALATDFDRHLLQRYGSLFASSFIQGYGQAITQQGTTTTSPLTGATTTTTPPLDNRQIFFAALGELGKQWSQAIKPYFQTPYTVYVDKGTSVGLLFLNDVDVTDEEG